MLSYNSLQSDTNFEAVPYYYLNRNHLSMFQNLTFQGQYIADESVICIHLYKDLTEQKIRLMFSFTIQYPIRS